MAAPWRACQKVNNSSIVAAWPRQPWQAGESRAIVLNRLPAGLTRPSWSRPKSLTVAPSRKPKFGGFSYVRRRQGRLRPIFHRPQGHPGGALRRCLEVRACDSENPGESRRIGEAGGGHRPVQRKEWIYTRYFGARRNQDSTLDRAGRWQNIRAQGEGFSQVRRRFGRQIEFGQ